MQTSLDQSEVSKTLGLDTSSRRGAIWRWLAYLVIGGGILGLVLWLSFAGAGQNGVQYVTATIDQDDLVVTVTATGTLEPTNTIEVSSELSGTIEKVMVDHNSVVEVGSVLAELDTDKLEAELAHARASLAAKQAKVAEAEATLGEAERDFARQGSLVTKGHVTEHNYEIAKATFERAKAALASATADVAVAEADLTLQETNLSKACICSPIEGIVLKRDVDQGQIVASSLQAPTLFTLADDLTQMELQVDVDEADVSLVEEGQVARFTVDAYRNRTFPATITRVRYAPDTTEGVVTYETQLSVDNTDLALRPGMTATAEITVRTIGNAVLIPNEALRFVPPQPDSEDERSLISSLMPRPRPTSASKNDNGSGQPGQKQVYILKDDVPTAITVTIGLSDGQRTEIIEGALKVGTPVLIDYRDAT